MLVFQGLCVKQQLVQVVAGPAPTVAANNTPLQSVQNTMGDLSDKGLPLPASQNRPPSVRNTDGSSIVNQGQASRVRTHN